MKSGKSIFSFLLVSALVSFVVASMTASHHDKPVSNQSVLDHVLQTNKLRCGYYNFPPVFKMYNDKGEKKPEGLSVDMMELIAKKTGLNIEWTEEITFGSWPAALQAGRIDAVCTPVWPDAPLGRAAIFTKPMFFATLSPLVRKDDPRFNNDLSRLNADDVTFVVQDGNNTSELTKQFFPKAKILSISASVDGPTAIENIVTKKADAMILDRNALLEYNKRSGDILRMVSPDKPVKYQPFVLATSTKAADLREFLNNALDDLHYSGTIDYLLKKWEAEPGLYARKAE
jgi:ABC-type amino acid transport substrate-binding protein